MFIQRTSHFRLPSLISRSFVIAYLQFSIFIAQQVEFLCFSFRAAEEAANILETKLQHDLYAFFKRSFTLAFVEKWGEKRSTVS